MINSLCLHCLFPRHTIILLTSVIFHFILSVIFSFIFLSFLPPPHSPPPPLSPPPFLFSQSVGHLLLSSVVTLYTILAVKWFEEPALVKTFGSQYQQYQKRVPKYFPMPCLSSQHGDWVYMYVLYFYIDIFDFCYSTVLWAHGSEPICRDGPISRWWLQSMY